MTGQEASTVFVSDHGDMLGELGPWFKISFFEGAARVPLMIAAPEMAPDVFTAPGSTIDICPTLCNLAGISMAEVMPWTHGESLVPLASGGARRQAVAMKYAAEASYAPLVSLCSGCWKYIRCALDPEQLFNLETDPHELCNLASNPKYAKILQDLGDQSHALWDLDRFDAEIRESQACRCVIYEALCQGASCPWDYQPLQTASERDMRNHMDLNALEAKKRRSEGDMSYVPLGPTLLKLRNKR